MYSPIATMQPKEKAMPRFSNAGTRWSVIVGALMLAACAIQTPQPAPFNAYHVTFDTDSYAIDPAGQQVIHDVASMVETDKTASITIVGRTDATGTPAYNMKLSQKRAIAVHDALVATGKITPDQIETAWTSEQPENVGTASGGAPVGSRVVDIFLH
jgi:outer membrane protein OmpA-like peptidoglycan-associated protein